MAGAYSQDLRDRVIDAVEKEGMSRRAAARRFGVCESAAVKWLQRYTDMGHREPVGTGGHRPSKLKPHRDFIDAVLKDKPDITLEALALRLLSERGVTADTSMLSRFLRREGMTHKKRRWWHASRIARTSADAARNGANIKAASIPPG